MWPQLTFAQKVLLLSLYGLLALMVIFSFLAANNTGKEGYDHCVQKKCTERGENYCSKPRELSNCCQGAGGTLGQSDGKLECIFKD